MKILITGGSGFIGTNFVDLLLSNNITDFINIDKQKPHNENHIKYWIEANILDTEKIQKIFDQYEPTHVVHLAARTDTASDKVEDYIDNTEGTKSLITVIGNSDTVLYSIITSTQYVYKSRRIMLPLSDIDFEPHTAYGVSKKLCEEATRNSNLRSAWTIIRPTNVWGPWHMRYPNELWKIIDMGLYFHPGKENPIKSYAYVKNVVHQIYSMLMSPIEEMNKKVFYLGDTPIKSKIWLNAFAKELTGKPVQCIPKLFLHLLSKIGTTLNKFGIKFPLNQLRFENMIDDYETPMTKTIQKFGLSHPSLSDNVKETVFWFKNEGKHFFPYWKNKFKDE